MGQGRDEPQAIQPLYAVSHLQELLGDDHVGVHVLDVQRRGDALEGGKRGDAARTGAGGRGGGRGAGGGSDHLPGGAMRSAD